MHVGPSIAYSTLGHLRDPVLNTMLAYGDRELAAFIFHELAHQRVYAAGDSDFSEAFATVVEIEGLRRWLAAGRAAARSRNSWRRGGARMRSRMRWSRAAARLAAIYAGDRPEAEKREAKAAEFLRLRAALADAGLARAGELNNARLTAAAAYHRCVPALTAELDGSATTCRLSMRRCRRSSATRQSRRRLCPRA